MNASFVPSRSGQDWRLLLEHTMDEYPTDGELQRIENWPIATTDDCHRLMEYVHGLWHWPEYFEQEGNIYYVSTGGWSGNEDIIEAMMNNAMFWILFWYSSRRGGHYVFCPVGVEVPK